MFGPLMLGEAGAGGVKIAELKSTASSAEATALKNKTVAINNVEQTLTVLIFIK